MRVTPAVIKQTAPLGRVPQDKAINGGALPWQHKAHSLRPQWDSYRWGRCVSQQHYHYWSSAAEHIHSDSSMGDSDYSPKYPILGNQPQLSEISLKHIAAGSSRAPEKQPPRSEQWIYVSFCLAAQRKSCGGDEYWAEMRRRNSARVLGMKTSSAVGEIRQRQRMKEVTCN